MARAAAIYLVLLKEPEAVPIICGPQWYRGSVPSWTWGCAHHLRSAVNVRLASIILLSCPDRFFQDTLAERSKALA